MQVDHPIAETLKAIRKLRRMRVTEVARAMGMPPRSYENLEAGTGRITYERIVAFADVTNSDPIAILTTVATGNPGLALHVADNKLMTIMMIAMKELSDDLGEDITYLTAETLVGGFTRLTRDLAQQVRKRETFAEEWLKAGTTQLKPGRSGEPARAFRPGRT